MRQPVWLRELGPDEVGVLQSVFDGLSTVSRYRRFHGAVPRLSPRMRDRLAAVDGRCHIAVAAYAGATPIGIGRLITVGEGRAELAVEVVDAWQGRGIGTWLVRAVSDRGRARGVTQVVADVLAENIPARRSLAAAYPGMVGVQDGPEITYTAALPAGDTLRAA